MAGEKLQQREEVPIIQAVTPLEYYRLDIRFGSGSLLKLNMENRLKTTRYYDLSRDEVFNSAATDGARIIFDTDAKYKLYIFPREAVNLGMKAPGEGMEIISVALLEDRTLRLEMKSRSIFTLNIGSRLHTLPYSALTEPENLQSVSTDGEVISFGHVLKIDMEELIYLMLTAPPIMKDDEDL